MWHVQHSPSFPSAGSWLLALILSLIQNVVPSCTCRLYFRLILMSHDNLMVNKPTYLSVLLSPLRPSALHNQFSSLSALPEMHIYIFCFWPWRSTCTVAVYGGRREGFRVKLKDTDARTGECCCETQILGKRLLFPLPVVELNFPLLGLVCSPSWQEWGPNCQCNIILLLPQQLQSRKTHMERER